MRSFSQRSAGSSAAVSGTHRYDGAEGSEERNQKDGPGRGPCKAYV